MDYRALLKKYMAGVYWIERTDAHISYAEDLTDEEYEELQRILAEVKEETD